jgi:A/G-specific adenine glycosylase
MKKQLSENKLSVLFGSRKSRTITMDPSLEPQLLEPIELRKNDIQSSLIQWGRRNFRHFAWRKNRTAYSVLVSEILLKRTTASAVNRVFAEFMALYPNTQKLSQADSKDLEELLLRIGYHRKRAEILVEMSTFLLRTHNGRIPRSKEKLLEIPYVGEYTANAILCLGYGIPAAMVDSNVQRIMTRLFLKHLPQKPSLRIVQEIADMLCPMKDCPSYTYALLDLGALVCRYGLPRCRVCPINSQCDYNLSNKPQALDKRKEGI